MSLLLDPLKAMLGFGAGAAIDSYNESTLKEQNGLTSEYDQLVPLRIQGYEDTPLTLKDVKSVADRQRLLKEIKILNAVDGDKYKNTSLLDTEAVNLLHPFSCTIKEKDFITYEEQLKYLLSANDTHENKFSGAVKPNYASYNELISADTEENVAFTMFSTADTSPGGNEVINCRWAFNRDDDIIQPFNASLGKPQLGGLGRVYREKYDAQQQILYITAGTPEFSHIANFYANAIDHEKCMQVNGADGSVFGLIGTFIGTIASLPYNAIAVPLRYVQKFFDWLTNKDRITKYYDFEGAMPLYYKFCNTLFVTLCVNMGVYPGNIDAVPKITGQDFKSGTGGDYGKHARAAIAAGLTQTNQEDFDRENTLRKANVPSLFRYGPSIYNILSKRDIRLALKETIAAGDSGDAFMNRRFIEEFNSDKDGSYFTTFCARAKATRTGADKFVAFRINKSTDSSESISNSTGQSTIAQMLNSTQQTNRNIMFGLMGGQIADIPILGSVIGAAADLVKGITNSIGVTNIAAAVLSGAGYFDIPDIWLSSSFSKSYNFQIKLRSPYGDPMSIIQSIYLPLCLLLPLACPRSVGMNSYTGPFLVRAYSKGMFAIPLGIIDSMTITRGESEFGWSAGNLPMVINVSFSIKDLSPVMSMAIAGEKWTDVYSSNSTINEYLMTLSGLGLSERLLFSANISRRMNGIASMIKSTWGSPAAYFGTMLGNTSLMRFVGLFEPVSSIGG